MDTVGQLVEYCCVCMPKKLAGMEEPPPEETPIVIVAVALTVPALLVAVKV